MATVKPQLPFILYACAPREGHMRPALQISSHLVARGFDVTLLSNGNEPWTTAISSIGAHASPLLGLWNSLHIPSRWRALIEAPTMQDRLAVGLADSFVRLLPSSWESIRHALVGIRDRCVKSSKEHELRERGVVVLVDTCFAGALPLALGADLPLGFDGVRVRSVGVGVVPRFWASEDTPPWGSGLPFDDSEEGRKRNLQEYEQRWDEKTADRAVFLLEALNCERTIDHLFDTYDTTNLRRRRPLWDAFTVCNSATLQMCIPSLELPTTKDVPKHLIFAGSLPRKPLPADLDYPSWFSEIQANSARDNVDKTRKRIVVVAQGTETLDHNELVIPTITGLSDRPDILVVAILCIKGATLALAPLPANARVIDYFPYDALLCHADVFVSASGYGGLNHAVANAVPVVQAGNRLDKPDIARRVERAGLGVFVSDVSHPPAPERIAEAVAGILEEKGVGFKKRAEELRVEAAAFTPLETIEAEILRATDE